uniref:Uncharacterized protein n=1 Tax=Arundo donax TaxID=35708 RepID=A0A0A8YPW3_ARUDO
MPNLTRTARHHHIMRLCSAFLFQWSTFIKKIKTAGLGI